MCQAEISRKKSSPNRVSGDFRSRFRGFRVFSASFRALLGVSGESREFRKGFRVSEDFQRVSEMLYRVSECFRCATNEWSISVSNSVTL